VNEPVPVPFDVFVERAIVGLVEVLQTTPLAVTDAPPSEVTLPPPVEVVCAMLVIGVVVVTVGRERAAAHIVPFQEPEAQVEVTDV
jgi:hypothetical protein